MMEKDNTLEELFRDYRPELADSNLFMERLQRKMEAVEYIRQVQEQQTRRYRSAILAAFVLGILAGCLLFVFILSVPDTQPFFTFDTQFQPLLMLQQYSRQFTLLIIALLLALGVILGANQLQERFTLPTRLS